MGFIRRRYYSRMRLYRDRPDVLTSGRWHWCPPGAKAIPYFHLFGPQNSDPYFKQIDPPVGEVPGKRGFVRGPENPRYLGQNWCGSEELWTHGSLFAQKGTPPVDFEGVPLCCVSGVADPGGVEEAGDATFQSGTVGYMEVAAAVDLSLTPTSPTSPAEPLSAAVDVTLAPIAATSPAEDVAGRIKLVVNPVTPSVPNMKLQ